MRIGAEAGASECHGLLAGALAAGETPGRAAEAAGSLCPGIEPRMLVPVAAGLGRALAGRQLDFQPWLPGDDAPLELRVAALQAWVCGFISGIGQAETPLRADNADTGEMLGDFDAIARGAEVTERGSEAEEAAFAELVEYVRLAVQNLYEELRRPG